MNNIINHFNNLEINYTDKLGRVTQLPGHVSDYTVSRYDSLNQHLWTGEALVLFRLFFNLNSAFISHWSSILVNIKLETELTHGLYTRHPLPYNSEHPLFDEISLDEYLGLSFSYGTLNLRLYAQEILSYHIEKNWCVSDHARLKNVNVKDHVFTLAFWSTIFRAIKTAIKTKDFTGSNDMDKILESNDGVNLLTNYRMPKDRLFIYLAAKKNPPLICWIHFLIAGLMTLRPKNKETSGLCLLFYKLAFLQNIGRPCKYLVKKFSKRILNLSALFEKYYDDKSHPFISIAKEIEFNKSGEIITTDYTLS